MPTFTLSGYDFHVTPAYASGLRAVGKTELRELDASRTERIRSRAFHLIAKLRRSNGGKLSETQHQLLVAQVAEWDRDLFFEGTRASDEGEGIGVSADGTPATSGTTFKPSMFDTELRRLAEERLAAEAIERGIVLTPEQHEAAMKILHSDAALREAAHQRVAAKQAKGPRVALAAELGPEAAGVMLDDEL